MATLELPATSAPRRGLFAGRRGRRIREALQAYLFLFPATFLLLIFSLLPVGYAFYVSLHKWRIQREKFIGFDNYLKALGESRDVAYFVVGIALLIAAWFVWRSAMGLKSGLRMGLQIGAAVLLIVGGIGLVLGFPGMLEHGDDELFHSILVTAFYSAGTVPVQLVLAFFIANLLFQEIKGKATYRMLYFLPYITPSVASAAVWTTIFEPRRGLINSALMGLGVAEGQLPRWLFEPTGITELLCQWLGIPVPSWVAASPALAGPSLALVAVIIYNIWVFTGYNAVIFLAGLGAIPYELYEAAKIDGAGRMTLLRHITLPLLSPTTFFLVMMGVIGTFKAFNHIYVMTQVVGLGGPQGTTETASIFIFGHFWRGHRYGYASAAAFILFAIILVLTWIQNRIAAERVHYA